MNRFKTLWLGISLVAAAIVASMFLGQPPDEFKFSNVDLESARQVDEPASESTPARRSRVAVADSPTTVRDTGVSEFGIADESDLAEIDPRCDCAAGGIRRRWQRLEAAHSAEQKDVYWAYETESLLEQFFAGHPLASDIRLTGVDCRTSSCRVDAIGRPESFLNFQGIVSQVENEPWSTFSSASLVGSEKAADNEMFFFANIDRAPVTGSTATTNGSSSVAQTDDGEDCPCAEEWFARPAEARHRAIAMEPKDAYWAYATEQWLLGSLYADQESAMFQISSIDCRTSYCRIEATGHSQQSFIDFGNLVKSVSAESYPGLSGKWEFGSFYSSSQSGVFKMYAQIPRHP